MNLSMKRLRRSGERDAGSKPKAASSYRSSRGNRKSVEDLALAFASETFDAERRLLSAGWHDPVGLHDAAFHHQLCGETFADPKHAIIYIILVALAEADIQPTVRTVCKLAAHEGLQLTQVDFHELESLESFPSGIDHYANLVADYARRRAEAHELLRMLRVLLGIDYERFIVGRGLDCRPTVKKQHTPKRSRRKQSRRVIHCG